MDMTIEQVSGDALERYARISIAFTVESVLQPELLNGGLGGLRLCEEKVAEPYVKDYDALEEEGPARWPEVFGDAPWAAFLAVSGEHDLGGAAVVIGGPGATELERRDDLAVLWDIRVHPDWRGRGVGTALFRNVAAWARERGCTLLKVETQNINVPACRFYAQQGCTLGGISRHGYTGCPVVAHETMLLWYLDL